MSTGDVRLGTPVRVGDVRIGVVTALLVEESGEHAFGLEVSARSGERWFLPWVAADGRDGAVEASSALVFGDCNQLDAYARRGARFVREDRARSERTGNEGRKPHRAAERVLARLPEGTPVS